MSAAGWFANQNERIGQDALFGAGHRPTARRDPSSSGWVPACLCSASCTRADDDSRHVWDTYDVAVNVAEQNLIDNEHGVRP